METSTIEKKAFIQKVTERMAELARKKAPAAKLWQEFKELMSVRSDAWRLEDKSGLLWHRTLKLHPGIVAKALSEPEIDWAMRDSNGYGVWDYLCGVALREGLSVGTVKALARRTPLELSADSTPLFWQNWNPKQAPVIEALVSETFSDTPQAWLGSKYQQRQGAISLAVELCSDNDRVCASAAVALNVLFSPKLDRALFSQDLITVMTVVQAALEEEGWLKSQVPNAVDFPIESPGSHRPSVVGALKKKLLASDDSSSRPRGAITQACLSLSLPEATPAPARLRF